MSTDSYSDRPIEWLLLSDDVDDDNADLAALDRDSGKVFVNFALAGDPSVVARAAARARVAILHKKRQRFGPAEWVVRQYPETRDRVLWIEEQVRDILQPSVVEARRES